MYPFFLGGFKCRRGPPGPLEAPAPRLPLEWWGWYEVPPHRAASVHRGTRESQVLKQLRARGPIEIGRFVIQAALIAVLLERMTALAANLHLFGDGTLHLLRIAANRSYFFWFQGFKANWFRSRVFTILVLQAPAVLATHLGVTSLPALSKIFGMTLFAHAPASLALCHRFSPRRWYLLFPLLSFFAGSMNVEGYVITDSQFLPSLYWPLLFILLFAEELKGGTLLLLLALSVPTVLCYESMAAFGLVLAGACAWRWRRSRRGGAFLAGLGLWYLLGAVLAVASVVWPFDPSNKSGFISGILGILRSDHLAAKASLAVLLCCALLLALPARAARAQGAVLAAGLVVVLLLVARVLWGSAPQSVDNQGSARALNLLLPLAATGLLLPVLWRWVAPGSRVIGFTAILVGALGFAQAFWTLGAVRRWEGMLATLRYELALHDGPIAYDKSIMSRERLGPLHLGHLHAVWPLLPLSIYEAENGEVRTLIWAEAFLPFNPFIPETLPDLSRYGVRYGPYLAALAARPDYHLGEPLMFARGGNGAKFLHDGWSFEEDWARWSTAQDFDLLLPLDRSVPVVLEADIVPFVQREHPTLTADIFVNDVAVGQWVFEYGSGTGSRKMKVRVPVEALSKASPVRLRFHIREPLRSPADVDEGHDERKLGLAFVQLRVSSGT